MSEAKYIRVVCRATGALPLVTIQRGEEVIPLYSTDFVEQEDGAFMHPFALKAGDTIIQNVTYPNSPARIEYAHE